MMRSHPTRAAFALALLGLFAMPAAQADPPKVTMIITNTTAHDARVELNSASTRPWMRVTVRANAEYLAYEIIGSFRLTGTVAGASISPTSVVLNRNVYKRVRIERDSAGRFFFSNP